MHIAIFGSAFNPPHKGHIDAISQLLPQFDEVWLVPSYYHAFAKPMLDFEQRLEMLGIIVSEFLLQQPITILAIEKELYQKNPQHPVYSYHLLKALQQQYPKVRFSLALGPDNLKPNVWQKFYAYQKIEQEFSLVAVKQQLPYRSTELREYLNNYQIGDSYHQGLVDRVGDQLASYLVQQNLQF